MAKLNADQAWRAAQGELQLQMPKATYNTWMKDAHLVAYEDGVFVIGVPNGFIRDWLENRMLTSVRQTLIGILGRTVEVRFIVAPQPVPEETSLLDKKAPSSSSEPAVRANSGLTLLNPRYTFETFVVGHSNRLAHAACLAVAERPATSYNPLFIYGGVGLGKTHLLHAVGHVPARAGMRVLYVSAESFTNDLINAIRTQSTEAFREKYRSAEVLLIDDIQFIANKERTQEEFFHTFNALHAANRQIVISCDRAPKAIPTLEERLRSRFEWGLIADIQPPELETRIAILRAKAESLSISVPDPVIQVIAQRIQSNIRELEGALNRVVAYANLVHEPLTVAMTSQVLQDMFGPQTKLSSQQIIEAVAQYYDVPVEDLIGRGRRGDIVVPRQLAMYLLREETEASFPEIGRILGGRDHTTVLHGWEKITELMAHDERLRRAAASIRAKLYGNHHN